MGTQLTGIPNFVVGIAFYVIGGIGFALLIFSYLRGHYSVIAGALGSSLIGILFFLMVLYAVMSSDKAPEPDVTARFLGTISYEYRSDGINLKCPCGAD